MEYLEIFLIFFKLGIVNFGGGYALFPLLEREFVTKRKWATNQELTDYYAVGQCTPGAFAVNVSTFIGIKRKGILGGIIATLGFVFPAFIIIFVIASLLTSFSSNQYVLDALAGIRVCVFILVLYAIKKLMKSSIKDKISLCLAILIAIMAIFVKVIPLYVYVIFAAIFGLVFSLIKEKRNNIEKEKKEKVVITKERKKEILHNVLYAISGFLIGLILGLIGFISLLFIKNKKYKNGLIAATFLWTILIFNLGISIFMKDGIGFNAFFTFFRIGALAFGGGLATIPFLNELAVTTDWYSLMDLANMIAVSESTPGAMGINMSTYVGYTLFQKSFDNYILSFFGSMITTLGLVTPSVIVIYFVSLFLKGFKDNKYVEYIFYGLRAASIGLIIAALYSVLKVSIFHQYGVLENDTIKQIDTLNYAFSEGFKNVNSFGSFFVGIYEFIKLLINFKALGLAIIFGLCIFNFKKHPIIYIIAGAFVGICFSMYECILV